MYVFAFRLTMRLPSFVCTLKFHIQSTLVISTSLISNNRLCRSENLVPVWTWKSNNRDQNTVEKRRNCSQVFHSIFNISLTSGFKLHFHMWNVVLPLMFSFSANLICRGSDIAKYLRESLGLRDNESVLYQNSLFEKGDSHFELHPYNTLLLLNPFKPSVP